jgi:hypothetical protein
MAAGWWILSIYELTPTSKMILSVLAGFYCLAPLTEFIPAATLITAIARYFQKSKPG